MTAFQWFQLEGGKVYKGINTINKTPFQIIKRDGRTYMMGLREGEAARPISVSPRALFVELTPEEVYEIKAGLV